MLLSTAGYSVHYGEPTRHEIEYPFNRSTPLSPSGAFVDHIPQYIRTKAEAQRLLDNLFPEVHRGRRALEAAFPDHPQCWWIYYQNFCREGLTMFIWSMKGEGRNYTRIYKRALIYLMARMIPTLLERIEETTRIRDREWSHENHLARLARESQWRTLEITVQEGSHI